MVSHANHIIVAHQVIFDTEKRRSYVSPQMQICPRTEIKPSEIVLYIQQSKKCHESMAVKLLDSRSSAQ